MNDLDPNAKIFADIMATGITLDFGGDFPLACLDVQVDYFGDLRYVTQLDAFLNEDGTHQVFWNREEITIDDDTFIWDIPVSEDGADGTLTKEQYIQLLARVRTVITQGLNAADKVLGGQRDFRDEDDGYEKTKAADLALQDNSEAILTAANA